MWGQPVNSKKVFGFKERFFRGSPSRSFRIASPTDRVAILAQFFSLVFSGDNLLPYLKNSFGDQFLQT
jgi:hypothetical protein